MDMEMKKTVTVNVTHVEIEAMLRHADEDLPDGAFGLDGEMWKVRIDIDTGIIEGWPQGKTLDLHSKVCDGGTYRLVGPSGVEVEMENEYVPDGFPGDHSGDYLIFNVDSTGKVEGWNAAEVLRSFAEYESDQG